MNEKQLKWNYKISMDEIHGTDEEKSRAAALMDSGKTAKVTPRFRGIPKIAAAAIALVCILALGGATAWATSKGYIFRDYFFKDSEKEFEGIYNNAYQELVLGDHKIVYEGSVYDESVDQGALNFSIWDKEGQPVELTRVPTSISDPMPIGIYTAETQSLLFKLGNDEWSIFLDNVNSVFCTTKENGLFLVFSKIRLDEEPSDDIKYKDVQFAMLDKDRYNSLKAEISDLDELQLITTEADPVTQEVNVSIDYDRARSEMAEILSKYDMTTVDNTTSPAQVVRVDNMTLRIGRMGILMEYNANDCNVTEFTMIREDGSRAKFSREVPAENGWVWKVEGTDTISFDGSTENSTSDYKVSCKFGFILGADEKVTIEVNGKTYK